MGYYAQQPPQPVVHRPRRQSWIAHTAAAVTVVLLTLWSLLLLFKTFITYVALLPNCTNYADLAVCTPVGRMIGPWVSPVSAGAGIVVVIVGTWIWPRRHAVIWIAAGVLLAFAGSVVESAVFGDLPSE
jgi:hypothetical protein